MNNKVVIIGCGNVGMSYAYALINQRTYVNKLYLIDTNEEKVEAEVMDLNDCLSYAPSKISINKGTYEDCKDADIVVLTAGVNQKVGESRTDLINRNIVIFRSIVGKVMDSGFDGIFLVATNPVDVLSYYTYKISGLPSSRVIGTGTSLDSARLQLLIGKKLCISPKSIQAYVIGEHGDSEFIPWSNAHISMEPVSNYFSDEELIKMEDEVKNKAYKIIKGKGATYYGIGMSMVMITNAILGNENMIIPLSSYDEVGDVYYGMPCILNREGIKRRIFIKLTEEEQNKLDDSIKIIKSNNLNLKQ